MIRSGGVVVAPIAAALAWRMAWSGRIAAWVADPVSSDARTATAAPATRRPLGRGARLVRTRDRGARHLPKRSNVFTSRSSWPSARPVGRPHPRSGDTPGKVPGALHLAAANLDARLDISSRGRSPDSRINASPCLPRTGVPVASLGFAPRSQWRDRAGLPPASLFGHRLNVAGGYLGCYAIRAAATFCTAPPTGATT